MRNKRFVLATASIAVLVLIALWLFRSEGAKPSTSTPSSTDSGDAKVASAQTFSEIASSPLQQTAPLSFNRAELPNNPRCEKQWNDVVLASPATLFKQIQDRLFEFDSECLKYEKDFEGIATTIYSFCAIKEDTGTVADPKNCKPWLLLYRAILIDKMTAGETDYTKLPFDVLLNKFLGRISTRGEDDRAELQKMADEIKRLQPDHPSTYRALVALELFNAAYSERGLEACEEGLSKNPNDKELREAWLFLKTRDPNFDLNTYSSQNPANLSAKYYVAAQAWKAGELDKARGILRELSQKTPSDSRFTTTLDRAEKATSKEEKVFRFEMTLLSETW